MKFNISFFIITYYAFGFSSGLNQNSLKINLIKYEILDSDFTYDGNFFKFKLKNTHELLIL